LFILFFTAGSFADKILPTDANIVGKGTEPVTLKCLYESSVEYIRLYWYKQYPNSTIQFLLLKGARWANEEYNPTDTRLESKTTRDSTELTIRGLKLSDSALYHCALRVVAQKYRVNERLYKNLTMIIYLLFVLTLKVKCIMFSSITGDSMGDSINPRFTHKVVNEGDDVTLSCSYNTSTTSSYLHWYRQHPKSNPKFLLYIYDLSGDKSDSIPPRLDVKVDKTNKQVNLIISSAAVSDSDLYYCALKPTVTGNPAALYKNLGTVFFADKIGPTDANIVRKENDTVKLKCSYESSNAYVYLYWYRQYPKSAPQFLLYKGAKSATTQYNPSGLESETTPDSTELTIRGLKLSDSALYHCALK
ncbi:hypothetical protein C0J45_23239, partial [Silurus meridionalis]